MHCVLILDKTPILADRNVVIKPYMIDLEVGIGSAIAAVLLTMLMLVVITSCCKR